MPAPDVHPRPPVRFVAHFVLGQTHFIPPICSSSHQNRALPKRQLTVKTAYSILRAGLFHSYFYTGNESILGGTKKCCAKL
jgi:hypothetical protein